MKKRLPIMLGVGIILIISSLSMIFSDMIKDPVNNFLIMVLPLAVGIVLVMFAGGISLRKFGKYMRNG